MSMVAKRWDWFKRAARLESSADPVIEGKPTNGGVGSQKGCVVMKRLCAY